jgi:hypothetical protein
MNVANTIAQNFKCENFTAWCSKKGVRAFCPSLDDSRFAITARLEGGWQRAGGRGQGLLNF